MKNILIWIAGLLLGMIAFVIGQALMLIIDQVFFNYLNFWIACILAVPFSIISAFRIVDFSFVIAPYVLLKNESISLFYVFFLFITSFSIYNLIFNHFYENLSSIPKWLYILIHIFYLFAAIGLPKILKKHVERIKVTKQVEKEVDEMFLK